MLRNLGFRKNIVNKTNKFYGKYKETADVDNHLL